MRVLLVVDPTRDPFLPSVATAATSALEAVGHDVDVIDLVAQDFSPMMTAAERRAYFTGEPLVCPSVAAGAELVRRSEALVFVYRTTLSTVTPNIKGWIERTFVPGVAFTIGDQANARRGLSNVRRLVGLATYDETRRGVLWHGDNGQRLLRRNVRLCGGLRTRSTWLGFYDAGRADEPRRVAFLDGVDRAMRRL